VLLALALTCVAALPAARDLHAAVTIESRIGDGQWRSVSAVSPVKGERVFLRVDEAPDAEIRWYRIIPDVSHCYSNARRRASGAHEWNGYDRIAYERVELESFRGEWEIEPLRVVSHVGPVEGVRRWLRSLSRVFGRPVRDRKDVGSFWFQVEIERDGEVDRSPGLEDADHRGLPPSVFRLSIRDGDGFLGHLASYFNVPGVFGSSTYQSENYIGVDCADVLVAAYSGWKGKTIDTNYSVAMLVDELTKIDEFDVRLGNPTRRVLWGEDIRPGDLIAVRYKGSRQYGHIAALLSDANGDGRLDRGDRVMHAGPMPLVVTGLPGACVNGHVAVLRFHDRF